MASSVTLLLQPCLSACLGRKLAHRSGICFIRRDGRDSPVGIVSLPMLFAPGIAAITLTALVEGRAGLREPGKFY
jgi:hypothetical protein